MCNAASVLNKIKPASLVSPGLHKIVMTLHEEKMAYSSLELLNHDATANAPERDRSSEAPEVDKSAMAPEVRNSSKSSIQIF